MKILFVGWVFFHCCLVVNNAMVAVRHRGITQDYINLRTEYQGMDHFNTFDQLQRVRLCDKVLKANTFFYIRPHANLVRPEEPQRLHLQSLNHWNLQLQDYNASSESDRLKYNEENVTMNLYVSSTITVPVRMFLCTEVDRFALYVTSGFRSNTFFLLVKSFETNVIKISAMVTPSLTLNRESRNQIQYSQLFTLASGPRNLQNRIYHVVPTYMHMCSLARHEYRYMHVCSLVADALSTTFDNQAIELDIRKLNYIRKTDGSAVCKGMHIQHPQRNVSLYGMVLPCAINREWSDPQFYLLRDQTSRFAASVFVLTHNVHSDNMLQLFAYVNDVMLHTLP